MENTHVNESILSAEILEDQKKNRIDHMKYLKGMEDIGSEVLDKVVSEMEAYDYDKYNEADVRRALAHSERTPEDFRALLSPAALPLLEEIAQAAQVETRKHFGNSVYMFTPIYIANYCENYCIYCGFNCHNKIRRAQLNEEEIEKEMAAIAKTGLQEILILTGESKTKSNVEYIGKACEIARKYFKVVDSDDWVDRISLMKILNVLKTFEEEEQEVDMLIANYVYEKVGMEHKKVIRYDNVLPENQILKWDEIGQFRIGQYILMHSVIYRTDMLKLCQLTLPKHTFYVDNIYVYYPLPHVRTLYYMNVDFYRYFIGREDQSVNEKVMISRIDQQIFVTKTMIDMYELRRIQSKKLRKYMLNYLAIMMTVSSILCIRSKKKENLEKKKELWQYLKQKDYGAFMKIRYGILGQTMNLPGRSGRKVSSMAYVVARRLIGFN